MTMTSTSPTTWKLLPPAVTEVQATIIQDPPTPPPAVTITVQMEEQLAAEDLYERRRLLNKKRAFRRQRAANRQQEQQGDNYDYSNSVTPGFKGKTRCIYYMCARIKVYTHVTTQ